MSEEAPKKKTPKKRAAKKPKLAPKEPKYSVLYLGPEPLPDEKSYFYNLSALQQFNPAALAEKHCILFVWTDGARLPETLKLIKDWKFTYKCVSRIWFEKGGASPCFFLLLSVRGQPLQHVLTDQRKSLGNETPVFDAVMASSPCHFPAIELLERYVQPQITRLWVGQTAPKTLHLHEHWQLFPLVHDRVPEPPVVGRVQNIIRQIENKSQ